MIMISASVLTVSACGGGQKERGEQTTNESTMKQGPAGEDRTSGGDRTEGEGSSREVTLEIGGDSGIEFSGTCAIGDEEYAISGQTPQSFGYDPNGQKLECEIRKQDESSGNLQVVLVAKGTRSVQQINAGVLKLTYDNGSISSSTSSGSASQVSSSSVSSSGSSVSSNSSVSSYSSTRSR